MRAAHRDWPLAVNWSSPQALGLACVWPMAPAGGRRLFELVRGQAGAFVGDGLVWRGQPHAGGPALDFAGSDDYVDLGDLRTTPPATLAFWFTAAADDDRRLLGQLAGATTQAGAIRINAGNLQVWSGSNWLTVAAVALGPVHHAALVFQGGSCASYLNGVPQAAVSCGFDFAGVSAGLGARFLLSYGNTFAGRLWDVRLHRRALPAAVIWRMWSAATRHELYRPRRGRRGRRPVSPRLLDVPGSGATALTMPAAAASNAVAGNVGTQLTAGGSC